MLLAASEGASHALPVGAVAVLAAALLLQRAEIASA
jgi:hypothetical protein